MEVDGMPEFLVSESRFSLRVSYYGNILREANLLTGRFYSTYPEFHHLFSLRRLVEAEILQIKSNIKQQSNKTTKKL